MTEMAVSDERKPLIFPPFHHQFGGEEVAVGAQTTDDVICNRGPPVSRENCCDSQPMAKWLLPSSAFGCKNNSGESIWKSAAAKGEFSLSATTTLTFVFNRTTVNSCGNYFSPLRTLLQLQLNITLVFLHTLAGILKWSWTLVLKKLWLVLRDLDLSN